MPLQIPRIRYGLTIRQARVYNLTCNLYKPLPIGVDEYQQATDYKWPPKPTYTGVRCHHTQAAEDNVPTIVGRGKGFFAENIDHFKFARFQDIEDGWLIEVTTGYDIDDGAYYVTQGSSQDRNQVNHRRPNQRMMSAVKVPKPPNIPEARGEGILVK